jgi:sucrose-6-phosphatase
MLERLLICTDLDRTLIPNGPQPETPDARAMFKQLAKRPEITLAYVSGRDRRLVENAITEWDLPIPQYIIGDVGTSIYQLDSHQQWHLLSEWHQRISDDWHGHSHDQLAKLLVDIEELSMQEDEKQNQFKLSYYLPLETNVENLISRLRLRLNQTGISANIIHSIDEINEVGLLDILPSGANKLRAIETLMDLAGFELTQTVFCGDSGNDLEVLVSPIPSVLVANCMQSVLETAQQSVQVNGNEDRLYVAQGDFRGLNGNYSAGMLEGIMHFHPCTQNWIDGLYSVDES